MPRVERKIIKNKPFFYLTAKVRVGAIYKKIQVYVGSSVPNDVSSYLDELKKKERTLVIQNIDDRFTKEVVFDTAVMIKLETARLDWKYFYESLSDHKKEFVWKRFAVQFIFESNAIEGSRLSAREVENIVRRKYIKKNVERREIQEVVNGFRAFEFIRGGKFRLNERSIIALHRLVTKGLGIDSGYKKEEIIVNNKPTVPPGEVRANVAKLFRWYKKQKRSKRHALAIAAQFHQRFEHIHPFADGNGRIGRLLFIWMLIEHGQPPLLFRYNNRHAYFSALDHADEGRPQKWYWFCVGVYKKSVKMCLTLL